MRGYIVNAFALFEIVFYSLSHSVTQLPVHSSDFIFLSPSNNYTNSSSLTLDLNTTRKYQTLASSNIVMAFPTYTKTFHNFSYPSISPTRPELSTAGKVILITGGGSGIGPRITHAFAVVSAVPPPVLVSQQLEAQFPKHASGLPSSSP